MKCNRPIASSAKTVLARDALEAWKSAIADHDAQSFVRDAPNTTRDCILSLCDDIDEFPGDHDHFSDDDPCEMPPDFGVGQRR